MTTVYYSLIMLVALGSGAWLLRRSQRSLELSAEQRIGVGLGAFCGAMLGAKLPFLMADMSGMLDGSAWFSSGKTIMCGMVAAYFGVELSKWILGVRCKTGDSFVVPVAVAVAIGRLGCFVAGCCYGLPTQLPWGMRSAIHDSTLRHPTQLYEFLFHISMAAAMLWLARLGIWKGQLAKFYILSYLLYRLGTEVLRPETRVQWGLTGYQWFALLLLPVFAGLWWRDAKQFARMTSEPEWGIRHE